MLRLNYFKVINLIFKGERKEKKKKKWNKEEEEQKNLS